MSGPTYFALDICGRRNLLAQEIPSAVGMRGFYVHDLEGNYDFQTTRFEFMIRLGYARPVSIIGRD